MHTIWQNRVKRVVQNKLETTTLAAFNTNVDVVVHLNNADLLNLQKDPHVDFSIVRCLNGEEIEEIHTENEFLAVLLVALKAGKSHYIVVRNQEVLNWLEKNLAKRTKSMGGQAGIIANQMAALGAHSMVYTSLLSPKQAEMFFPEVKVPVVNGTLSTLDVLEAVRPDDQTKENWILEYPKGETFEICGQVITTPRANRVILATRPEGIVMGFAPSIEDFLPQLGRELDVAFLAGFHYAPTTPGDLESYLDSSLSSIHKLKQKNPRLRLHFEYVPMSDDWAEKTMMRAIASEIQSFGINENETRRLLDLLGFEEESAAIEIGERAYCLYIGCLRIMEQLGFERIQLHNLGYYVVLLKKPYELDLCLVRDACLYASAVNAIKAKYGGYVLYENVAEAGDIMLSDVGLEQLRVFGHEMRNHGYSVPDNFEEEGILELDDHFVLIVPAHIIPHPVSTVGMGDTISSASFAYEWNHASGGGFIPRLEK